jgi:N-acetylmuramoyl-L-alanine amidase
LIVVGWQWKWIVRLLSASTLVVLFAAGPSHAEKSRSGKSCDPAQLRIVLDVGHTAEEPGAISVRSVPEYEFNLQLAREIKQALQEASFANATLQVMSGPARAALIKRVVDANAANADLLLSIHHDSVPDWLLQHMDEEGGPKRFNDRLKGFSIFVSYENANRTGSLQFAKALGRALRKKGLSYAAHYTQKFMLSRRRQLLDKEAAVYRFDKLHVLRAAQMPAILFEAGLIINPVEEIDLAGRERQQLIAAAVTEAAEKFCQWRASRSVSSGHKRK